jgi:hypothetical protein
VIFWWTGSVGRRIELLDHLKLRLARREAAILRGPVETMRDRSSAVVPVTAVASRALQEQAGALFGAVCVNPRALSPEAAEFMLSVAASQCVLSPDESLAASHVDLALQGVHPRTARPVLLACTTTMLGAAIDTADVEKALRRADLWRRAVGPAFSVLPVVAGYALPPEVADLAKHLGVLPCDISR